MLIGHNHQLRVVRLDRDCLWLDTHKLTHGQHESVALPLAEAPDAAVGDQLTVFVHTDSQARPVATTARPFAELGECTTLKVSSVAEAGAFLDWGIGKELLLPFAEQRRPVSEGTRETVLIYLDNSGRLAASSRLDNHLTDTPTGFRDWQAVSLLVYQRTDLGFKAVVNQRAIGLLYKTDVFQSLRVGTRVDGYIKRVRPDGRLDLSLQARSHDVKDDLSERIMAVLIDNQGVSFLTDKSAPEDIYAAYSVSKKNYKRALSSLYKQRLIRIESDRIERVEQD